MTEPSEAAINSAWDRAAKHGHIRDRNMPCGAIDALAEIIQQVSDAVKGYFCNGDGRGVIPNAFAPFILLEPVDPLMDFLEAQGFKRFEGDTEIVHKELAKRGLKIVEADHAKD